MERPIHDIGFEKLGVNDVKKYHGVDDFDTLKASIKDDAEGYVIRFKSGYRMKIKGEEYCRLHSIITKISSRDIWTYLKDDLPMDELLQHVPEEFDKWVNEQIDVMKKSYQLIDSKVNNIYLTEINTEDITSRKDLAMRILKYEKSLRGIFCNMYDGMKYSHMIWAKLYPKYSKPFTVNDAEGEDN